LPSLPSASFNFLRNSGGVAAFGSLIYNQTIVIYINQKNVFFFTLVNFDASDGVPFPASFSAITRNSYA
jgi:hypothetical protein